MHRNDLLQQLGAYQRSWPNENIIAHRFIDFVETNPNCFERSLKIGHVTGSAWVVNAAGTHVLLTHHRKLNMWLQLGGHADGHTDIFAAAQKEANEESGLTHLEPVTPEIFDIDIHRIPARKKELEHDHYDVRFAFRATASEAYIVSAESHDLAWVEIKNIESYTTEESMLRMAEKWKAYSNP